MVPRVGQRIGPYEILGRLGTGGMGLVFSAWDGRLHRDVAIKLLRDEYATGDMRARFLQEARAVSGLNHPNICTIFDLGEHEGDPYMVMELLKGHTLRSRILAGTLPFADILQVATEVAEALGAAHARGIIHRDIKPANIILVDRPEGRFVSKVLDFGLAKIDLGEELNALDYTNAGSTVGTVAYMSPEQARGEPLDSRSDLFALGTVCYEMATGDVPFRGATSAMVFVQLLNHPPESVRQLNSTIPKEFERVLEKMLDKDRSQRYQSAGELVAALEELRRKVKRSRGFWKGILGSSPTAGAAAHPRAESSTNSTEEKERDKGSGPTPTPVAPLGRVEGDIVLRPVRRIAASETARRSNVGWGTAAGVESATQPIAQPPEAGIEGAFGGSGAASSSGSVERVLPFAEPFHTVAPETRVQAPEAKVEAVPEPPPEPGREPLVIDVTPEEMLPAAAAESGMSGPIAAAVAFDPVAMAEGEGSRRGAAGATVVAAIEPEVVEPGGKVRQPRPSSSSQATFRVEELRHALGPAIGVEAAVDEARPTPRGPLYLAILAAAVMLASGGVLGWKMWSRHHVPSPLPPTVMALAPVANATGDEQLGGILLGGLELALADSHRVAVVSPETLTAGLRVLGVSGDGPPGVERARRAAQTVGAGMVLYPTAKRAGSSYLLSAEVFDSETGARKAEVSENAASREQLAAAIDRLAVDIRTHLGESGGAVAQSSMPLTRNATSSLEALAEYAQGRSLVDAGQYLAAMHAFDAAAKADPHFVASQLALAELLRRQRAEVESMAAAGRAHDSSAQGSARTRQAAQAEYDLYGSGDLPRAEAEFAALVKEFPDDEDLVAQYGICLRLEGKYEETLAVSQAILARNPYSLDVSGNAEYAMIALDRTEAAVQMESQIQRSGRSHAGLRLLINLLSPHDDGPAGVEVTGAMGRLAPQQYEAMTLDAGGMLDGGLQAWHAVASQAGANAELQSAAGHTLAQAALDRALVEQCATARGLIADAQGYPQGPTTLFDEGMAAALCGDVVLARQNADRLATDYRDNWGVKAYELPDLRATILWKQHGADARKPLDGAHTYDRLSLTPYLRGLIDLDQHQPQAAIVEFQGMLEHRGATTLANPVLYAMAQIGLARAYAASGDTSNSADAYQRFLTLWGTADPSLTMLREARTHAE